MMDDQNWIAALIAGLGGGGLVGWYRERRKGRKDASDFALQFIREQSLRIDALVQELAQVKAEQRVASAERHRLEKEADELKIERALLRAEIDALKTALQVEKERATALAARERQQS